MKGEPDLLGSGHGWLSACNGGGGIREWVPVCLLPDALCLIQLLGFDYALFRLLA